MPSAYAERDRFDLSSTRAIYLKFAICGLSIAAHAPNPPFRLRRNAEKQSSEQGLGRRSNSTRRYLSTPFGSTKPRMVR